MRFEKVDIYELRRNSDGYTLSGGPLTEPLHYQDPNAVEYAMRMVNSLAQLKGGEVRIYDSEGKLAAKQTFKEGVRPTKGELGDP